MRTIALILVVGLAILPVSAGAVMVGAVTIFEDEFDNLDNWTYSPDNCAGFTAIANGGMLEVNSYGACGTDQWEGIEVSLDRLISPCEDFVVTFHPVVTTDVAGQMGGVMLFLIDSDGEIAGSMNWYEPQSGTGSGDVSFFAEGEPTSLNLIYGDLSGSGTEYPTIDTDLALRREGDVWSAWVNGVQKGADFVLASSATITGIRVSFYNFKDYTERDIGVDHVSLARFPKAGVTGRALVVAEGAYDEYAVLCDLLTEIDLAPVFYTDVPIDQLNEYCLLILTKQSVANGSLIEPIRDFVARGGGVVVSGAIPYYMGGASFPDDLRDWLGAGNYCNSNGTSLLSADPISIGLSLGTELYSDQLNPCNYGPSLCDLSPTATQISHWSGGCAPYTTALINEYGAGRVYYANELYGFGPYGKPEMLEVTRAGVQWLAANCSDVRTSLLLYNEQTILCDSSWNTQAVMCATGEPLSGGSVCLKVPDVVMEIEIDTVGTAIGGWSSCSVDVDLEADNIFVDFGDQGGDPILQGYCHLFNIVYKVEPLCREDFAFAWDTALSAEEARTTKLSRMDLSAFVPFFGSVDSTSVSGYEPGDVNRDGYIEMTDILQSADYLFLGGPPPCLLVAIDVNGDCIRDLGDILYMAAWAYLGGEAPGCACSVIPPAKATGAEADLELMLSDDENSRKVSLRSESTCLGLQLEFKGDGEAQVASNLPDEFEVYSSSVNGVLTIAVLDLELDHSIPTDGSQLLSVKGDYELVEAKAVNQMLEVVSPAIRTSDVALQLPAAFALYQNYPNPFNPSTIIEFDLPSKTVYTVTIYNMLGQQVERFHDMGEPGRVKVTWDASEHSSGVYMYRLETRDGFESTRKMLLVK